MTAPLIQYMMSGWGQYPVPDITEAPSVTKISRISGKDVTTFAFTPDVDYQAYQLRAVPSGASGVGTGVELESGGAGEADDERSVDVTDDEMVDAGLSDGTHVVKVFLQNYAGNWTE